MSDNYTREATRAADRGLDLEIKYRQTVGHLRRTSRDIAANLFGVNDETAEVVTLQDAFEKALSQFCQSMRNPAAAALYVAPDTVRAMITAQSEAAKVVGAEVQALTPPDA